jgi:hypothetical protein
MTTDMAPQPETVEPDWARLSELDIRALAARAVEDSDEYAAHAAAKAVDDAQRANEAARAFNKEIAAALGRAAEIAELIRGKRVERGDRLADGASTASIDKDLRPLRDERERLEDHVGALTQRLEDAEHERLLTAYESIRQRRNAFAQRLREVEAEAAVQKSRLGLAGAVADLHRRKLDAYASATDASHRAVGRYRELHPTLHVEETQ